MRKVFALGFAAVGLALAQFTDVKPSDPEWLALQALSQMGVVYGYPDGTFKGDRAISRREMVLMLYRLWIKAEETRDKALQEATAKLAQEIEGLAKVQTDLQSRLEALEASVMSQEEAEEIRAQIAALRNASATLEEAVSRLVSQYADLAAMYQDFQARLAQVDQRSLAWTEDATNLQKGLRELTKRVEDLKDELTRTAQALQAAQDQAASALRQELQAREANLRSAAEGLRQELNALVQELESRLTALQSRVEALEGRLTGTREELFQLAEDLRKAKADLRDRIDTIQKAPPPLYAGATLSGLSPLILYGFLGHDTLVGFGVRGGLDWRQDVGEFRVSGLLTLPVYREPARGSVGFGLAYAFAGPAQGESTLLLALGAGVDLFGGLEAYAEGRAFFPLDGATPFARFGLGFRFRP
ncbi:S-layer homology domain-containing protein [Fervidobacterium sp.]